MKTEIIGNCTLHLADLHDCHDHFVGVADMVMTDPPYLLTSGGKYGLMRGAFDPEEYDNGGQIVPCNITWAQMMPMLYAALKDTAHAYVMCNNRHVQEMLTQADEAGFYFHNLLVWDKRTATANRWYMKNLEFVGFFSKGNAFQINDCGSKQLLYVPQVDESGGFTDNGKPHPTEKPVLLMRHYVENSTQEGQTVFDPFMGSGTTGVACARSNRRFIGVEKDPRFFDMARRRIEKAMLNTAHERKLL